MKTTFFVIALAAIGAHSFATEPTTPPPNGHIDQSKIVSEVQKLKRKLDDHNQKTIKRSKYCAKLVKEGSVKPDTMSQWACIMSKEPAIKE